MERGVVYRPPDVDGRQISLERGGCISPERELRKLQVARTPLVLPSVLDLKRTLQLFICDILFI